MRVPKAALLLLRNIRDGRAAPAQSNPLLVATLRRLGLLAGDTVTQAGLRALEASCSA